MAHIDSRKLKSGAMTYHVIYMTADNEKRKLTGFSSKQTAQIFAYNLNRIVTLRKTGSDLTTGLIEWIDSLSDEVHAQLVNDGFLQKRIRPGTLEELAGYFLRGEIAQKELKDKTLETRRVFANRWFKFFGKHRPVLDITPKEAREYREWHAAKYQPSTWEREIKSLKTMFQFAVDDLHWTKENPFRKFKGGKSANKAKLHFVTLEETRAILEECPNAEMRLIFCLARFGGLRVSELPVLDWEGVNFKRNSLTVNVPKKTDKRSEAMGEYVTRITPLWPELRQAFEEYWENLPEGAAMRVFPHCPSDQALTSRFKKILRRAGVQKWPKFFQSMRATRATELRRKPFSFQVDQINDWIGHTEKVAEDHYVLNTLQDIADAAQYVTMDRPSQISMGTLTINQNSVQGINMDSESVFSDISAQNPMGAKMGGLMGIRVGEQGFYESSRQISEVKKSLENTEQNQEKEKGVTSLQHPNLASKGFEPLTKGL